MGDVKKRKDQEWLDLCAWVEKEIFGYDDNQKLHTAACMKLRGLRRGQGHINTKYQNGDYSFQVILNTFKANKIKILNSIKNKKFDSEAGKMSYVCAIVRNNINDVYTRMKDAEKTKEKSDNIDLTSVSGNVAEYKRQTKDIDNDTFEDIW